MATFQEGTHLVSFLDSHVPLFQGFPALLSSYNLGKVLGAQAGVPFLARVDLPCGEPVSERALLLSAALHCYMVLFDVLFVHSEVFFHLTHLLLRLHLHYDEILVLGRSPLAQSSLQPKLLIAPQNLCSSVLLSPLQMLIS